MILTPHLAGRHHKLDMWIGSTSVQPSTRFSNFGSSSYTLDWRIVGQQLY